MLTGRRVLWAVALLAVAARLPGVFTQALWQDEVASARVITEPTLPRMLAHVARTESTPPLWYTLAWLAHRAGVPVQDVRLLSVAAGGALAALVVDLARRVVPLPFAALAGLLTAFGSQLASHGHELRAYELLALFSALFARVLLAAVVAAGGLTHYFFALSVLAGLVWLWGDPAARAARRRATAAICLGAAAATPWLPVSIAQYHQDRFWWIPAFRLRAVLAVPLRLFTPVYGRTELGLALSLVVVAVVAAGCLRLARLSSHGRLVAALAVLPLAAAALAWAGGVRVFALRNMIGIAPFVSIVVAAAIASLPRRALPVVAALVATALALQLAAVTDVHVPRYDLVARRLV